MKFKSATVLIILVALLSIAVSGCSSWGVALDTSANYEDYNVGFDYQEDEEREKNINQGIQVLPKVVASKRYGMLIPLMPPFEEMWVDSNSLYGIDYDIIYLGYNTGQLIDDVINNRKSLSSALEEPNTKGKNNFQMFVAVPSFVVQFPLLGSTTRMSESYHSLGILYANRNNSITPYYEAISYKNKKFDMSSLQGFNASGTVNSDEYSFFSKGLVADIEAATESGDDKIEIRYFSFSFGFRFYL